MCYSEPEGPQLIYIYRVFNRKPDMSNVDVDVNAESIEQPTRADVKLEPIVQKLRVVSYNIQAGIGADRRYDIGRICQWFAALDPKPDIVAVQVTVACLSR